MAKSVNHVFLLGNVGRDPEVKITASGMTVASFSLATSERVKDERGNWGERPEWHNLVAFGSTAELIRDHVKKGDKIMVEGRLVTRSWEDKANVKHYMTEVHIAEIIFTGAPPASKPAPQQAADDWSNF
jgi:single-strand DNA-binding protein